MYLIKYSCFIDSVEVDVEEVSDDSSDDEESDVSFDYEMIDDTVKLILDLVIVGKKIICCIINFLDYIKYFSN